MIKKLTLILIICLGVLFIYGCSDPNKRINCGSIVGEEGDPEFDKAQTEYIMCLLKSLADCKNSEGEVTLFEKGKIVKESMSAIMRLSPEMCMQKSLIKINNKKEWVTDCYKKNSHGKFASSIECPEEEKMTRYNEEYIKEENKTVLPTPAIPNENIKKIGVEEKIQPPQINSSFCRKDCTRGDKICDKTCFGKDECTVADSFMYDAQKQTERDIENIKDKEEQDYVKQFVYDYCNSKEAKTQFTIPTKCFKGVIYEEPKASCFNCMILASDITEHKFECREFTTGQGHDWCPPYCDNCPLVDGYPFHCSDGIKNCGEDFGTDCGGKCKPCVEKR